MLLGHYIRNPYLRRYGYLLPDSFMRVRISSLLLLVGLAIPTEAQQVFDRKSTTVNNMGLSVTNVGTYGRPNVRNQTAGLPSFEYPRGSGTEHMFEAGIWIGAVRGGSSTVVSTSAITTSSTAYSPGSAGFEFTNDGTIILEQSSLPESPLFSPLSVSHQDLVATFSDRRTSVGAVPIAAHQEPLFADVKMETYSWNFGFTENLSIVTYTITNTADFSWDSVHVGIYSDIVVRNVNTTLETGTNFFNKTGLGYLDDLHATYAFDARSTDSPSLNTYASVVVLGSEYRGMDFHPNHPAEIVAAGYRVPKVRPAFWQFSAGTGAFQGPQDDVERFNRMSADWPLAENREPLRTNSTNQSIKQLISLGPFPEVAAGESFTFYVAWVAALKPDAYQNIGPGKRADDAITRAPLVEAIDWAYRLFEGTVENGVRRRFLVPEPPRVPKLKVELEAGKTVLYWDDAAEASVDPISGEQDFEGYRIYRSTLGDDIRGTMATSSQLIREYDVPGNEFGFNTGFNAIRLATPKTFPGDATTYSYRYEVDGMLSGWQYLFAVTAFDRGGDGVPSLETSLNANSIRVFPGTGVNDAFTSSDADSQVGVYPNPYRLNAAWDGATPFTRRLMFYNLPAKAQIRVYTLAGEIVATLDHDAATYTGDTRWFNDFSVSNRLLPGGEYAWDILSDANQNLTTGLYLYTVKDAATGHIQTGKLVIIK